MSLERWPLYCCRTISSLDNKKMALNKLENTLEHVHLSNDEPLLYIIFTETTEDIYMILILAIEHKHSAQVLSTDVSYGLPFNSCVNHYDNNHVNKHYYLFISDGRKLFSSDKAVEQEKWGWKTPTLLQSI